MERYSRQIKLISEQGQIKLKNSKVLIIGAGGLGSPAAIYLATAGIGTLAIADFDKVDITNLHRQILHNNNSINKPKTESAKSTLNQLNPETNIIEINEKIQHNNVNLIKNYDIIIDGSDNLETRYLVNDKCKELNIPYIYGAASRFEGQLSTFINSPCLRCLLPELPIESDKCEEVGILGPVAGIIGTLQAIETIKLILNLGTSLSGKLLTFNALSNKFSEIIIKSKCKDCQLLDN